MSRTPSDTRTSSGTRSDASYTASGGGTTDAFLLMETGDFLLLETGDKIILDGITTATGGGTTTYRSAAGTRLAVS